MTLFIELVLIPVVSTLVTMAVTFAVHKLYKWCRERWAEDAVPVGSTFNL